MALSNTLKIAPALPAFARISSSKILRMLTSSFFLLVRLKMRDFLPRACVRVKRTRGLRAATGCGRFGPMVARKGSSPRFDRKIRDRRHDYQVGEPNGGALPSSRLRRRYVSIVRPPLMISRMRSPTRQ